MFSTLVNYVDSKRDDSSSAGRMSAQKYGSCHDGFEVKCEKPEEGNATPWIKKSDSPRELRELFRKNVSWEYEHEYRYVIQRNENYKPCGPPDSSKFLVLMNQAALKAIIFGNFFHLGGVKKDGFPKEIIKKFFITLTGVICLLPSQAKRRN